MMKVTNPQNGGNIKGNFSGKMVVLAIGESEVYPERVALDLKKRYPWLRVENVNSNESQKDAKQVSKSKEGEEKSSEKDDEESQPKGEEGSEEPQAVKPAEEMSDDELLFALKASGLKGVKSTWRRETLLAKYKGIYESKE